MKKKKIKKTKEKEKTRALFKEKKVEPAPVKGAFSDVNKKILLYFGLFALLLLLFLKFIASDYFVNFVDFLISFFPMLVIVAMVARGYFAFRKHHHSYTKSGYPLSEKETLLIVRKIRREVILETLGLLIITLLFYVLYSPSSWYPVVEAVGSFNRLLELDNFFLMLAYGGVLYLAGAVAWVAYKYYRGSTPPAARGGHPVRTESDPGGLPSSEGRKGSVFSPSDEGEIKEGVESRKGLSALIHSLVYRTFIIFFALFAFSALAYPGAYAPVTDFAAEAFSGGNVFESLSKALVKTGNNLSSSIVKTNTDLTNDLKDTKDKLDQSITQANKDLKTSLEQQLTTRTIVVEGQLVVTDTSTTQDILPESDTNFDLGSSSKSWNALYIHQLHGASAVTIGSSGSNHGVNATDDLVVSGDAEVKGTLYIDKALDLASNKIVNLSNPTGDNDAANKTYVDNLVGVAAFIQRSGSTMSPVNGGDSLDMSSGNILGVSTLSAGSLNVSGTLTAGTVSASNGSYTNLSVLSTPSSATAAANKAYVDAQIATKDTFIELTDAPHTYTGSSGKFLKSDGSGLAFAALSAADILTGNFDISIMPTGGSWNLTSDLNIEGNTLYVDEGANRVGIGTGSPNEALEVSGNVRTSGSYKIGTQQVLSLGAGALTGNLIVGDGGGNLTHTTGGTGYSNVALGFGALAAGTTTQSAVIIGYNAGSGGTGLDYSVLVGRDAGMNLNYGGNTMIGFYSGRSSNNASENVFVGRNSGYSDTTGSNNVNLGAYAGHFNQTGGNNVIIGHGSGYGVTGNSYSNNTFIGYQTGYSTTTGGSNLFAGYQAGYSNTSATYNTFLGVSAGYAVTTGNNSTFVGTSAGGSTTTGGSNTFLGYRAGALNTTGYSNVFIGNDAGLYNSTGPHNVGIGANAILNNTAGWYNVAIGEDSGKGVASNTFSYNTFIGFQSGYSNASNGNANFFGGYRAGYSNTTGSNSVVIGNAAAYSNTSGVNSVYIGSGSGYYNQTGSSNVIMGYFSGGYGSGTANSFSNNTMIGHQSGYLTTTGGSNVFIGYQTGYTNTVGTALTFLGYQAGNKSTGSSNTFLGNLAGTNNSTASYNTFVGSGAGRYNTTGEANTAIGLNAGRDTTTQGNNTFLGYEAGRENEGAGNTGIGHSAGLLNTTGSSYTYIGTAAGRNNTTGINNTALGYNAGYTNSTGSGNVFLGYGAGYYETGSNKLFIDNAARASEADARTKALIYGIFDAATANQSVTVNGALVVGNPTGGSKGEGTINATAVYDDNVLLTDYVFDKYFDGQVRVEDRPLHGDYKMLTMDEMKQYVQTNRHLPTIPGREEWEKSGKFSLGKLVNHLWETSETQGLYVAELNETNKKQDLRITDLDSRLRGNDNITTPPVASGDHSVRTESDPGGLPSTEGRKDPVFSPSDEGEIKEGVGLWAELKDDIVKIYKELVVTAKVIFNKSVSFLGKVTFFDRITFGDRDMGGFAKIEKGKSTAKIKFEKPYDSQPVVTATPEGDSVLFELEDVSKNGFTLKLKEDAKKDIIFHWIALAINGNIKPPVVSAESVEEPDKTQPNQQIEPEQTQNNPTVITNSNTNINANVNSNTNSNANGNVNSTNENDNLSINQQDQENTNSSKE